MPCSGGVLHLLTTQHTAASAQLDRDVDVCKVLSGSLAMPVRQIEHVSPNPHSIDSKTKQARLACDSLRTSGPTMLPTALLGRARCVASKSGARTAML
jgi:hypothetical protein